MPRVVLAMSGGVDSSVSATLLQRQGYDVVGLFMRTGTHPGGANDTRRENKKGCCSAVDASDARRVADRLDIPFYALDFEAEFAKIIDYFADEYLRGRTPNPCVVCNNWLKFGQLWAFGQQLGADFIATGHYAQVLRPGGEGGGRAELHKGLDPDKDQSYVLNGIRREILEHLLFPIGGMTKSEVRRIARESGMLNVAEKPDSVEICFVPSGNHVDVVRARGAGPAKAGQLVERDGTVVGTHDGIDRFTVGQRKGLGIATAGKRFVLELVPDTGNVVVGDAEDLLARGLVASKVNWLIDPPETVLDCGVKIRYRHAAAPARVTPVGPDGVRVEFAEAQTAITPGQAVAFYDGTRVLGGGWIDAAIP